MRERTLAFSLLLAVASCTPAEATAPPDPEPESDVALGRRYAEDAAFRRAALVASLENPDNGYSRLRLERYTEDRWGALPLWDPEARPVSSSDLASTARPADGFSSLDVESVPWEETALLALGRRAFFAYPAQIETFAAAALGDANAPARYGLWEHADAIGGLVWTKLPRDAIDVSFTCSTCHATVVDRGIVAGKNAALLDVGRLASDFRGGAPSLAWGPGRLDVTGDGLDNPVAVPDLRPVRYQSHLQRAGTVKNGLVALSIRTETLLITSLGETVRPPRKLVFALALYLTRLEPIPSREPDDASARGEASFEDRCAGCHVPPTYGGPPVPLGVVGTDPSVGESSERGTGGYRVPSLRGVGDRTPLLATGAVNDLREMFDPARRAVGHPFGLELDAQERADLVRFLETL